MVAGRPLKAQGQAVTRHKPVHDWDDIENTPFSGPVPVKLPTKTIRTLPFGGTEDLPINPMTRQWWRIVTRMPHCRLWTESDWEYCLATAIVADRFFYGNQTMATELARRERVMGVTVDSRRALRIRYKEPAPMVGEGATVTQMDDYRAL